MSLEQKLLKIYLPEEDVDIILEQRRTSLRRYIQMIGMNWQLLSPEQVEKIANSAGYKQFRQLRKIKSIQRQSGINEAGSSYTPIAPKEFEPSHKYKHIDPTHISKQAYYAGLVNRGYDALKSAHLYRSTGPKGFLARHPEDKITFKKSALAKTGKLKTVDTITKRVLKKQKEYHGKAARFEEFNMFEDTKKRIPKVNMKEVNPESPEQCDKQFEITKTVSGKTDDANMIQINPKKQINKPELK